MKSPLSGTLETIFGNFTQRSKRRLDLTYDYETSALFSFRRVAEHLNASAIIDIGANIGVYSIFAGGLGTVTQVHSFEPAPVAYAALNENIALQPNPTIFSTYNIAISSQSGSVPFRVLSPMSGANAIAPDSHGEGLISVTTERLDNILSIQDTTVSIKIDVEGHELAALEGMADLLKNNRCYLQVECLTPSKKKRLCSYLSEHNYMKIFALRDDLLFISPGLHKQRDDISEIVLDCLSADLTDLMKLRVEKRLNAKTAKALWVQLGYERDPLLRNE